MDDPEPRNAEILFDAVVGPDYDGAITTEQVCEILGLTIRGTPVRITEEDRRGFSAKGALDLSGATSFLNAEACLGQDDADRFLAALRQRRPDTLLLFMENPLEPAKSFVPRDSFNDPPPVPPSVVEALSLPGSPPLFGLSATFFVVANAQGERPDRYDQAWIRNRGNVGARAALPLHLVGKPLDRLYGTLPGDPYETLTHRNHIHFSGQCATADADGSDFLTAVVEALSDTCSNRIALFDLTAGDVPVRTMEHRIWYGTAARTWCSGAPRRLLSAAFDSEATVPRVLGARPD